MKKKKPAAKKTSKKAAPASANRPAAKKAAAPQTATERLVRELASLLDETSLTEIEVEHGGTRVRVARQGAPVAGQAYVAAPAQSAAAPAQASKEPEQKKGTVLASPMVGTAYMGAQPGAAPFAKVGDTVKEGQTLVIIEAMKTMNQVAANKSGRVVEIYVQDGQPVEFGEPLMLID